MKIYVLADMEGISGIHLMEQVKRDQPLHYPYGKRMLMNEINYVVDTLFDLGVAEVVVRDDHGGGYHINLAEMDPRAVYEPPCKAQLSMLDESFDGLILLGHHSKAGTLNGFLDHTVSSMEWFEHRINGVAVGEIGIVAAKAGNSNVPVIVVTGDEMTVKEAKDTLGTVECAVVKRGVGRNWADCLSIQESQVRIREAIKKGLGLIGKVKPYKPQLPATCELTFYRSDFADRYNKRKDVERVDARTIRKTITTFYPWWE